MDELSGGLLQGASAPSVSIPSTTPLGTEQRGDLTDHGNSIGESLRTGVPLDQPGHVHVDRITRQGVSAIRAGSAPYAAGREGRCSPPAVGALASALARVTISSRPLAMAASRWAVAC